MSKFFFLWLVSPYFSNIHLCSAKNIFKVTLFPEFYFYNISWDIGERFFIKFYCHHCFIISFDQWRLFGIWNKDFHCCYVQKWEIQMHSYELKVKLKNRNFRNFNCYSGILSKFLVCILISFNLMFNVNQEVATFR